MENFFQRSNLDRQTGFIFEGIKMARSQPLDKKKFDDWYYQKKEFSEQEAKEVIEVFNRATVQVETLAEYRILLEALHKDDKKWVIETLAHENAHANKGTELKALHQGYTITFIRGENGHIQSQPAAIIDIPETFDIETKKHIFVEIVKAPDTYEGSNNYLSDGDEYKLQNINEYFKE